MAEIIVKGVPVPLHFGIRAIAEYTRSRETDFHDTVTATDTLDSIESIVSLTVSGLNEGARRAGKDTRYTEDDVWDMFDEEPELIFTVSELFVESITPLTERLGGVSKNSSPAAVKRTAKRPSGGKPKG